MSPPYVVRPPPSGGRMLCAIIAPLALASAVLRPFAGAPVPLGTPRNRLQTYMLTCRQD